MNDTKETKVLVLRFKCSNGKNYNVRIQDASTAVKEADVKALADQIIKVQAFDFDGKKSPYSLGSAVYTTTNKQTIVAAK